MFYYYILLGILLRMDWANIILTSISMSVDAMTVGAVDGIKEKGIKVIKIILIALTFGIFQFGMPTIGYFIGQSFRQYVEKAVPWIGFGLLMLLAIKSFIDWFLDFRKRNEPEAEVEHSVLTFKGLLVQGVATSIDALCIGFVYMNKTIPQAMLIFGIIGITTFVLSFITTYFGHFFAKKLERWGSLIAAIVFVLIAVKIVLSAYGILKF